MEVIRNKRHLTLPQAWSVLNLDDVHKQCKSCYATAIANGTTNDTYANFTNAYCKGVVEATHAPPNISDWANRVAAAQFLSTHGYPRGGQPYQPPVLTNLEYER
jgi:hypothetical protein